MNRTDRLLAVVLELQGRGRRRAEDLAAVFETSKRTIYRDIQALSEAGVPIVAIPGQGYSLMEGYFLPPLTFSADEAAMLLLGADVVGGSFDAQYRAASEAAGRKISAVLPEPLRFDVGMLRESIHFLPGRPGAAAESLAMLRRAIMDRSAVGFVYHTRSRANGAEGVWREVDPYTLIHTNGSWYLTGYDHLRHGIRTFRLGRMEELRILERTFTRPERVPLRGPEIDSRPLEVRALFRSDVARWVREDPSFFMVSEEETPEGLLVTLRVRQESDILSWLLGWGRNVRVLAPETLRRRITEEARALVNAHESPPIDVFSDASDYSR